MKNTLFIMLSIFAVVCHAQETVHEGAYSEIYSPSKKEKLTTDAYEVFRTNKFLDLKNKESLIEKIEGAVYKEIDLNTYLSFEPDWEKIEKENISTFEKEKNAQYSYADNTLIEVKTEYGSYDVRKEIKTVYNSKFFVLLHEKKYFVGTNFNRTESIINEYDTENRVIKITKKTEYPKKEENTESVTIVKYKNGIVDITSENGNIICEFTKRETPYVSVSKLSANETVDYFRYAVIQQNWAKAKEYCTEKMAEKVAAIFLPYPEITDIKSLSGTGTFGEKVTIKEDWEITCKTMKAEKCKAVFYIIKQKNGWKIDDFEIAK